MTSPLCNTFLVFLIASILTACGGGGANAENTTPTEQSSKHEFRADVINLISATESARLNSKIDLFYKNTGIDEVEIASNLNYLLKGSTSSFGWEGLPKANLTFTVKDSYNNQSVLSTITMEFNSSQPNFFLLAMGKSPSLEKKTLRRVNKLDGVQHSYRFTHANALAPGDVDIYDVDTKKALALNLSFTQTSSVHVYDASLAETSIIVIPAGTQPSFSNTANYLVQTSISHLETNHLNVLVANPDSPSSWSIKQYSE
ncbi:hypothetical protein EKG38_13670 [Shewanella canadensis]|uniref:DUF4397 domain-containing protein n=1 Tax=Shewanella canadensis TaxID=271096 RepID=A0A3S0IMM0_9GAMM|nr:hypothetical protein [Shewanella canadensis]RTR38553.1 hypothetical protein EKG38_13670 [Shewanella canadensis]